MPLEVKHNAMMTAVCARGISSQCQPLPVWSAWCVVLDDTYENRATEALGIWVLGGHHKICERFYFAEEFMYEVFASCKSDPDCPAGAPEDAQAVVRVKESEGSREQFMAFKWQNHEILMTGSKRNFETSVTNKMTSRVCSRVTNKMTYC